MPSRGPVSARCFVSVRGYMLPAVEDLKPWLTARVLHRADVATQVSRDLELVSDFGSVALPAEAEELVELDVGPRGRAGKFRVMESL